MKLMLLFSIFLAITVITTNAWTPNYVRIPGWVKKEIEQKAKKLFYAHNPEIKELPLKAASKMLEVSDLAKTASNELKKLEKTKKTANYITKLATKANENERALFSERAKVFKWKFQKHLFNVMTATKRIKSNCLYIFEPIKNFKAWMNLCEEERLTPYIGFQTCSIV